MPRRMRLPLCALAIAFLASIGADAFHHPIASLQSRVHRAGARADGFTSTLCLSITTDADLNEASPACQQRRAMIRQSSAAIAALLLPTSPAFAEDTQQSEPYTRAPAPTDKFQFGYTLTPPPSFVASNKPLKTHLDEINFAPPDVRGYTIGITVDPVRISKLQEFGTPEEVAARVVTAEVNRDGVFEVTLAKDPKDSGECYDIEYISDGKRGTKHFVTRIYVKGGFLYVLTAQSKEAEYDKQREKDIAECVNSFRPL
ncbi:hypothetical protein ACHAXT_000322 [Thalassiosira profunda]